MYTVTVSHHSNKRNLKPCNDLRRETLNDLQGFFYLFNKLFIMIYKLECKNEKLKSIEFEKVDEEHLLITIINKCKDEEQSLFLNKKDVYYLIGALHLLHKEMK